MNRGIRSRQRWKPEGLRREIIGAGGSIGAAVAIGISLAILPLVSGIWLLSAMPDEESLAGATVARPPSGPNA